MPFDLVRPAVAPDPLLLGFALLIAALGAYAIAALGQRAYTAVGHRARIRWMAIAVVAGLPAVWADALLAMLAYLPPQPVGFRWQPIAASLGTALVGMAIAARIMLIRNRRHAAAVGGALCGLSMFAAQLVCAQSLRAAAPVDWRMPRLGVALAFAIAVGAIAATWWTRSRSRTPLGPILLFALMVCGTHFGSMHAAVFGPPTSAPLPESLLRASTVADIVGAVLLLVAGFLVLAVATVRRSRLRRIVERAQLAQLAEVALEGLVICEDNRIVWINRSLEDMAPGARAACIGRPIDALLILPPGADLEHDCELDGQLRRGPTDTASTVAPDSFASNASTSGAAAGAASDRADREAGSATSDRFDDAPTTAIPVRVLARTIHLSGRLQRVVAIRDQRERLRAEAAIQRMAESDGLTGLANRSRFHAALDGLFALASRPASTARPSSIPGGRSGFGASIPGTGEAGGATGATEGAVAPEAAVPPRAFPPRSSAFALLAIDLDRFKSVNDSDGHAAGDSVLAEVGRRLRALVRDGDLVARLGGDEFAVVARTGGVPQVEALAERIVGELSRPFAVDGRVHHISASVGIALAHRHGDDPDALQRSADLALYDAKAAGRGRYRLFQHDMRVRMQERSGLEQALRSAIADDALRLAFQPQVDARSGAVTGAEALVRWMHPVRGLMSPADFIPLAEETQLIVPIGEWVLRAACGVAAGWPDDLVVTVNLSPAQCREPTLPAIVAGALAATGLPGRRLELEVTESVLIDDKEQVASMLAALKRLGLRLSLDDFGTGYASLAHLHRFPFDRIKIDRAFVARLPDPGSAAIVRAVVALGAGLSMQTTAEGVETEAQRRFVVDAGCDQLQGYLISRPVAASELPEAFRRTVATHPGCGDPAGCLQSMARGGAAPKPTIRGRRPA